MYRHLSALLLLAVIAAPLSAQRTTLGLEATAGVNLPVRRALLGGRSETEGFSTQPGAVVGLDFVIRPSYDFALTLGADYLRSRGRLRNLRLDNTSVLDESFRVGDVKLQEDFLRLRLENRFYIDRVQLMIGFQLTTRLGTQSARYDYRQTTRVLRDNFTGTIVTLDPPSVSNVSTNLTSRQNGYVGIIYGVGYEISPRIQTQLRYDLGIHVGLLRTSDDFYLSRHTIDLTLAYRLIQQ